MRLIDKIGAWVLQEACRTAATWPEHLTVAVNLSPAQFLAGSVSDIVAAALKEAGLAAHRLELEITETLLLGNSEAIMAELQRLKAMGVAIVMDDFGTGYSSLSYLWRFPFDKIKIDRSFMQGFEGSGRDAKTVVKTIIALGRELNMRVTVEGVETAAQAAFLDKADGDQARVLFRSAGPCLRGCRQYPRGASKTPKVHRRPLHRIDYASSNHQPPKRMSPLKRVSDTGCCGRESTRLSGSCLNAECGAGKLRFALEKTHAVTGYHSSRGTIDQPARAWFSAAIFYRGDDW